ncbi:hypothetical protein, partial [Acidithiobacillus thiooxidans]|uniref:hypothetical protein n=1 Tax=Acidithiobacillus thiooxidans TaxID=930 RepID=UPI001C06DEB8
ESGTAQYVASVARSFRCTGTLIAFQHPFSLCQEKYDAFINQNQNPGEPIPYRFARGRSTGACDDVLGAFAGSR